MNYRNKQGYLPSDLVHSLAVDDIPVNLRSHFRQVIQEQSEADFMISTTRLNGNQSKERIILDQLDQLGLTNFYKVFEVPKKQTEEVQKVLIVVKIPDEMVDLIATQEEIDCAMTYNRTFCFIKQRFHYEHKKFFNKFSSTSKDDAVESLLSQEIDFGYYLKTGVITDSRFMHKGQMIEEIQRSFQRYQFRLFRSLLSFSGVWQKYFQPINMVKNYYGEKVGFEYAFLYHY